MKIKNTFLVLICALLAAGCASAPQSQTAASSDVQKRVAELAPHHALVIAGADVRPTCKNAWRSWRRTTRW